MKETSKILNELKDAGAFFLVSTDNQNYYNVPDNYFTDLSENILLHVFVQSLPRQYPYTVATTYFDNLPGLIVEKIRVLNTLSAENTTERNVYSIPEGYFYNLADDILKRIKANEVQSELEAISPLLSAIPKTNVYTVPDNYLFESEILEAVKNKSRPPAKIFSIDAVRKWKNFAVAASIAIICLLSGFFYFSNKSQNSFSGLSDSDIQKRVSVLSDEEISNYLKNNNVFIYTTNTYDSQQFMNVQNMIESISDKEIEEYLNENSAYLEDVEGI
jgi:hypothetical protein